MTQHYRKQGLGTTSLLINLLFSPCQLYFLMMAVSKRLDLPSKAVPEHTSLEFCEHRGVQRVSVWLRLVARNMDSHKTPPVQIACPQWGQENVGQVPQKQGFAGQTSQWMPTSGATLNNPLILHSVQIVVCLFFYYSYGFIFYIKKFSL